MTLIKHSQKGMTLIEVMIAATLMATIAVLSASSLRLALNAWGKTKQQDNHFAEFQNAEAFLRRQLEQAKELSLTSRGITKKSFLGDRKSIKFVSRLRIGSAGAGLYLTEFRIKEHNSEISLIFSYHIWREDKWDSNITTEIPEKAKTVELLNKIQKADFKYYGKGTHNEDRWYENWNNLNQMPKLVKFRIKMASTTPEINIIIPIHTSENE